MSRQKVKSAKDTICDTCALNLRRYEFNDILAHKLVIRDKTD